MLSAAKSLLRAAAGELHAFEPGLLRREAFAEEAGTVAEVAGADRVVDGEPVEALDPPFRLFAAEQLEGAPELGRLAARAFGEDVGRRRPLGAPAELGDPERLARVFVGLDH